MEMHQTMDIIKEEEEVIMIEKGIEIKNLSRNLMIGKENKAIINLLHLGEQMVVMQQGRQDKEDFI